MSVTYKNRNKLAEAITKKELHKKIELKNTKLDSIMKRMYAVTFADDSEHDFKRENANIDANTAMGTMLKYGTIASNEFFDTCVIPNKFADAHRTGDIHIHDKDFYALTETCCQINLLALFKNGFSTGHGFIRPPAEIRSYAALACIAIQANQNEQHGGQSIPNFDYAMADGVRKTYIKECYKALSSYLEFSDISDNEIEMFIHELKEKGWNPTLGDEDAKTFNRALAMSAVDIDAAHALKHIKKNATRATENETFQAMEALIHNLNTMNSRAGAQVPFSSLNYGTDTSEEGRLAIKSLLLATKKGLGRGETPIFPIQIFKLKEGVSYNKEDPNYDLFCLAVETSARRLFPNFSFIDSPFNLQYYKPNAPETEVAYMGCRTRVMGNINDKEREITYGRGNLSFTSINLPRLAITAKGNVKTFYKLLDEKMDLVKEQLLHRFSLQCEKHVYNYPFLMGQGVWMDSEKLKSSDFVRDVLKHGTLSIGFIGLAESLKALVGVHHGESEEAQKLGLEIISHMREVCDRYMQEEKLNFSLLATPAEGLSGRFVKIDREMFGKLEGITDREYYTNSFHVPVYYDILAHKKIELEGPYHELCNAGHISYVEIDGDAAKNPAALMSIIKCMKENNIGYGSINHPLDRDPECGYMGIIDGNVCPCCGREEGNVPFSRIRRITGYLVGGMDRWNNGKRAEERDRVKHG